MHLIVPVFKEAEIIQATLEVLCNFPFKIILSQNGPDDGLESEVQKFINIHPETQQKIKLIKCPEQGKAAAIVYAAKQIPTNDLLGFIDADLSADPGNLPLMKKAIQENKADIVIASRLLDPQIVDRSFLRTLSSRLFNLFVKLFLKLDIKDAQCGLKLMNSKGHEILKQCQEKGWFLDIEFLSLAKKKNLKIIEIPVKWIEFRYPNRKSRIKHVQDGIKSIFAIYRIQKRIKNA